VDSPGPRQRQRPHVASISKSSSSVQNHAEALHRALVEERHRLGRIDPLRILCTKSGARPAAA